MPRGTPNTPRDAQHNPVMAPAHETSTADFKVPQRGAIDVDAALHASPAGIEIVERLPAQDYADALKFGEDPVTVVLTPSSDPKAAKSVYCGVNGKGAEVWDERSKRWLEFKYLPVARVLTVKRKYLEVLARSRVDTYATREVTATPMANQDGFMLEANTVPSTPFTVRSDPAGDKGYEWFQRVMAEF